MEGQHATNLAAESTLACNFVCACFFVLLLYCTQISKAWFQTRVVREREREGGREGGREMLHVLISHLSTNSFLQDVLKLHNTCSCACACSSTSTCACAVSVFLFYSMYLCVCMSWLSYVSNCCFAGHHMCNWLCRWCGPSVWCDVWQVHQVTCSKYNSIKRRARLVGQQMQVTIHSKRLFCREKPRIVLQFLQKRST